MPMPPSSTAPAPAAPAPPDPAAGVPPRAGRRTLARAFAGVALTNLVSAGLGFLSNVVLARLLDLGAFGRINLLFSMITIFFTIADFGFSNAVVIFHNRHHAATGLGALTLANRTYVRVLGWSSAASLPVVAALARTYQLRPVEAMVVVLSFALFSAYRYVTALHQAVGDWTRFGFLTVLNNLAKILCVLVAVGLLDVWLGVVPAYTAALYGYLAYSVVVFASAVLTSRGLLRFDGVAPPEQRREFRGIVVPIGVAGIFIILTMRMDSLIIEKVLGSEQLGIYSAANTLALVFPLITGSLMNVFLRESAEKKELVLRRILGAQRRYFAVLLAAFAFAIVVSKPAIGLLFGPRFVSAADVFRILLVAYIGGVFFTPLESYFYANHPRVILWMRFVQLLLVVAGAALLVRPLGLAGVAWSVVGCRLIAWVYFYVRSRDVLAQGGTDASVA